MQIKGKLLDKLRCDFCAELLSYSPILINDEGKNMCGRCIPSKTKTGTFVKNLIYEEIAAFVQFPCINSNNGCCAMVKLENAKYHEENCPFRKRNDSNQKPELECPLSITNECSWSGSKCEFELHCKNKHLNTIIDHPYCKKPNLNRDSESYFILKMFEHLFILQVKCSLSENTLWHNVQFLGPSNLAHLFEYNLEFKKGKSRLAENQNIKPYNPSVDIKSNGIRNKITNLINLLGSYDDINVEIR